MFDFDDLEEQEETTTAPPELVAEEEPEPSISWPNVEDVRTVEDVGTVEEAAISSPPKEDLPATEVVAESEAVSSPPKEDPPVPAATEVVAEPEATLSLPREDPPAVPEVEVLPQAAVVTEEAPQTPPAQLRRPPGLMSPPKDSTCEVLGPQLHLSPQSRGHLLRPEELRQARGAARSVPETFLMAFNAQFYCYLDASGQALDVVATSGQSRVVASSKICSCALKPDDRHLLMVCEDGNFFTYRLDRGSASTVLQLHFLEDPPKEVLWHPTNQKVFLTLHPGRVRLWNLQMLKFSVMGQQAKSCIVVTPEMLETCSREAHASDPKETLQRMAVSSAGHCLCATSEKRFWRWSLHEEASIPEAFNLEIRDLEGMDASQELRLLNEDRALLAGEKEITLCALPNHGSSRLLPLQELHFHGSIRCEPQSNCFLALSTASEEDGEVDLLLHGVLDLNEGFHLRSLEAFCLGQDASETSTILAGGIPNMTVSELEAGYPPGLPFPSRPPGLPSPQRPVVQEPAMTVAFEGPPGLMLDDPQVADGTFDLPSQSSARSDKETLETSRPQVVESSDDAPGDTKPVTKESAPTVHELSSFMQKRADRASDLVVDQILETLPAAMAKADDAAPKIMHECRQIEEQARRTQRQVLKVLERPRPSPPDTDLRVLKERCSEVVHSAATAANFPSHLAKHLTEEPRSEVIRQHLRPSKEKLNEVLREGQKWSDPKHEVKSRIAELPTREALEGFMNEVSKQSEQEMKRLLSEVQAEGLQISITDACRRSVKKTLQRQVEVFEAEANQSLKAETTSRMKHALIRRLGEKAMPLHTELDLIEKELLAAGDILAKTQRAKCAY